MKGLLNGKMKRTGFLAALTGSLSFLFKPSKAAQQSKGGILIPRYKNMDDVPDDLKENGGIALVGSQTVVFGSLTICKKDGLPALLFDYQNGRAKEIHNTSISEQGVLERRTKIKNTVKNVADSLRNRKPEQN